MSSQRVCIKSKLLTCLELVYRCRLSDEKMQKLVRQNKGGSFHLYGLGHELVGVICGQALRPGVDWGLPYYRDRAFAVGLGCTLEELFAAFLAKESPHHSGGRMMPEHFCHRELHIPCQSSVVGSQFLQAVGVAKGEQLAKSDAWVYVSGGEGSTSQGEFHEALNYACLHRLNVLFVIQDNGWAISVPIEEQIAGGRAHRLGEGYAGLHLEKVDGGDYVELDSAMERTLARTRERSGPTLLIARVPRLGPHSSSDDPSRYMSDRERADQLKQDPIVRLEETLLAQGCARIELEQLREQVVDQVETSARIADQLPDPDSKDVELHLFKACPPDETAHSGRDRGCVDLSNRGCAEEEVVIVDALNHALDEAMEEDEGVILFGQDVADGKGGVFGVTRGLSSRYGKDRCFNTPLAEATIIGTAIGLSIHSHFKPVIEIQFADYFWTGVNQLFNELASYHYRSNGEWNCPIVIRMPYGGYIQGGPYHSQSVEAHLCHVGGLKVVVPSQAADAKRLLKQAIEDPNPVLFLEHKALYRQRRFCARPEPDRNERLPFGQASIVAEGDHLTLICYGMMVPMALELQQQCRAEQKIGVEVIDLRSLVPLDRSTILASVHKTGKVLILHEASKTCGFGAELAAQIAEHAFYDLDAPIVRIGALDLATPYAKILEEAVLPHKDQVKQAIYKLAAY